MPRQYLVIDLKSFYASVECVERGLDPLVAPLVVADLSRSDKTICLAVSPALKARGVRNRCRIFEIPEGIPYVVAPPRMALYMRRSCDIYSVYLRYLSAQDIHVYSVDEAFLDVSGYLDLYGCTARELGERIRSEVVKETGIPATCGLGTNLYLAKVALDITAKHSPDFFGELDEQSYRDTLWSHTPITDFWRVGPGTQRRLAQMGIHTMGQLALHPREPIYDAFGIDAEILIDHAWGREPVTMADIKAYRSQSHSLANGQVLSRDVDYGGGLLIAKEMADQLVMDLVAQGKVARSLHLDLGYRATREERALIADQARRQVDGRAGEHGARVRLGELFERGTAALPAHSSSLDEVWGCLERLYRSIANPRRPLHRIYITLGEVRDADGDGIQMSLFQDVPRTERELRRTQAVNAVRDKFGSNALLRAHDLLPQATARERNGQIGGHRSGM